MRRSRDAMQDVELVDVATDLPLLPVAADPQADAAHARRVARRRRLARRWWPLPVVLVAAVTGTQLVLDAREDARVAARQEVPGVLRAVEPGLPAARRFDQDTASVVLSGVVVGDLRVGVASPPWDAARELVALDRQGDQVWSTSLEDGEATAPDTGMEYPLCVADAEPVQVVRCLVLDRSAADAPDDSGTWSPVPPSAARLVSLDATTGEVRGTRDVEPMSGWGGAGGVQVLTSITDGTMRVTAWDTAADRDGPEDPAAAPLWRTDVALGDGDAVERLFYPPSVTVTPERVLVQGDLGSWSFAADDGRLQAAERQYLSVSRTGRLLAADGQGAHLVDDTGAVVVELAGTPLYLDVDDGTVPGLELITAVRDGGRVLAAVDVETGVELWSAPHPRWTEASVVLLEGVLYGSDQDALWAVDAATGRELWRTVVDVSGDGTSVMTDGRYAFVLARPDDLAEVGVTVGPPAGEQGGPAGETVPQRALAAFDLGTGRPAWATRLPADVQGVWPWQGDLLGYGDADVVVLN
ncbi:outer membrane protein assembly factor BamB family protein [Cellulomonas sp. Marseille-Q8402]